MKRVVLRSWHRGLWAAVAICAAAGAGAPGASASIYPYRPDEVLRPDPLDPDRVAARYRLWIDPARTQWIAWSTSQTVQTWQGVRVVDAPGAAIRAVRVTVTDPHGRSLGPLLMGEGAASPRAVLFGRPPGVPSVAVEREAGRYELVDETGAADDVILTGGAGYYTFHIEWFAPGWSPDGGVEPFVLVSMIDELPPEGVVGAYRPARALPSFLGATGADEDDDGGGNGGSRPTPQPTPPPQPTPEPIPEPATLGLVALGLGCLQAMRRRRSV